MPRPAAAALALCALLAAVGATLAQPTGWSCSSIPTNWGSDQENSDNPAWVDLAAQPSTVSVCEGWVGGWGVKMKSCCTRVTKGRSLPPSLPPLLHLTLHPHLQEVFDKIYATYQSRYSSQPLAAWPNCEAPVPTAVGCQQARTGSLG